MEKIPGLVIAIALSSAWTAGIFVLAMKSQPLPPQVNAYSYANAAPQFHPAQKRPLQARPFQQIPRKVHGKRMAKQYTI